MSNSPSIRGGMLPRRAAGIVMPLLLSVFMTCIVSLVSTAKAIGLPPDFPWRWAEAWGISWLLAFPTLLVVLPVVRWLVNLLVEQ